MKNFFVDENIKTALKTDELITSKHHWKVTKFQNDLKTIMWWKLVFVVVSKNITLSQFSLLSMSFAQNLWFVSPGKLSYGFPWLSRFSITCMNLDCLEFYLWRNIHLDFVFNPLTLSLPPVTKTEFLLTISIQYQAGR